jgi:hypothetical protein
MMFNNILSKAELDALLTPEELQVFKAEQQDMLEHEIMLSPAHLLMALRELDNKVGRLTERVQQLEQQLVHNLIEPESEIPQVFDQVVATALFEQEQTEAIDEVVIEHEIEEAVELFENVVESVETTPSEIIIEEPYIEHTNETNLENQLELEPIVEEIEGTAVSELEMSMLIANDPTDSGELEASFSDSASPSSKSEETSLISRSARHRERKPSIFSRLRK